MSNHFPAFAKFVHASFQGLVKHPNTFVVAIDGDVLYAAYLAAFPEGSNPLFKKRTEHDCSCCRQFIRRAGNVVAVDEEGLVHTVWDKAAEKAEFPYNVVAKALVGLLGEAAIGDLFRVGSKEGGFGALKTHSMSEAGHALTWNHFHTGEIPTSVRHATPDAVKGDYRTRVQVFERGLKELKPEALDTVRELTQRNNIYRGAESAEAVAKFSELQKAYRKRSERQQKDFIWTHTPHEALAKFRNTAIGDLVVDLSEGMDLEDAVRAFETKMDARNYKRPSALITPMMVKKALETIQELGLEPALERRFARLEDISVNDVLWVDNTVKPLLKGGLGDVLLQAATSTRDPSADEERAETIAIDDFMKTVLPQATGMEVLFKGEHVGNLMSLTAPVHADPKPLFKWNNNFAWSYNGNITDSIKERVKKAGGNVTNAKLRVSLSWFNFDDLDLHVFEPGAHTNSPGHIFFRNMYGSSGGHLDVDMNAGSGHTREPVENVSWATSLRDGAYRIAVNNYSQREKSDVGFIIEVENSSKISNYTYGKEVRSGETVVVATLHLKGGRVERVEVGDSNVTTRAISQEKWGLKTEQYVKVNAVTLSPNYWGDNAVGNKHTFFVLEGAKNEEAARGIYNEFLHADLMKHKKVFEVIGEKTKCQPTEGQLSGLGFSSTKKDAVLVKVTQGKKQRIYNVHVG